MLNSLVRRSLRFIYFKMYLTYKPHQTIRFGSEYGGWNIPINLLTEDSVCYLAGAGIDISFDLAIASQFKSKIEIFDPAPRAYNHYLELADHVSHSSSMPYKEGRYCINSTDFNNIRFNRIGLWNKNETIKFYAPKNKERISYSTINLQKTDLYFEAEVKSLPSIMKEFGHNHINLLKLDIDGSEYKVLDNLIEEKIFPDVICVEFAEIHNPLNIGFIYRIHLEINKLHKSGYNIINIDSAYNITFLKSVK